ncbi:hypothetical protein [Paenibacillus sp. FSL A5-0031]|nr:hypothetical protein [Paenibacillus sp. FSL A5-0031]
MSHSVQEVYEKKTAGLKQTTESDHEVAVKAAIVAFGVIQFFKKE